MPADRTPQSSADYPHVRAIPTRWKDNDVYGHVNNVEYYSFFDTVINAWLIARGRPRHPPRRGDRPVRRVALRVPRAARVPRRRSRRRCASATSGARASATRSALFAAGRDEPAATGWFVHVFVDRETRRPVEMPAPLRAALERLQGRMKRGIFVAPFDELSDPRLRGGAGGARPRSAGLDGFFVWDHIRYSAPVAAVSDPGSC